VIAGNPLRKGGKYRQVPCVPVFWGPKNHGVCFSLSHLPTCHLDKEYPEGFCIVAAVPVGGEGK
jgi:hypothetical protein